MFFSAYPLQMINIWINRIHDLITTYDPSFGVISLGNNNKGYESIFLFDESISIFPDKSVFFSGWKLASYVYWSFFCSLLSTFQNYFLVYFKLFYSVLRKGWRYTSSIINNNNIRMCLATYTHPIPNFQAIFSDAPSSSTVLSYCVSLNFFCWIPFLFLETFLLINPISLCLLSFEQLNPVSPSILFPIFVIFRML